MLPPLVLRSEEVPDRVIRGNLGYLCADLRRRQAFDCLASSKCWRGRYCVGLRAEIVEKLPKKRHVFAALFVEVTFEIAAHVGRVIRFGMAHDSQGLYRVSEECVAQA